MCCLSVCMTTKVLIIIINHISDHWMCKRAQEIFLLLSHGYCGMYCNCTYSVLSSQNKRKMTEKKETSTTTKNKTEICTIADIWIVTSGCARLHVYPMNRTVSYRTGYSNTMRTIIVYILLHMDTCMICQVIVNYSYVKREKN